MGHQVPLLFFFRRLFNSATQLRSVCLFQYTMTGITASTLMVTVLLLLFFCRTLANRFVYGKALVICQKKKKKKKTPEAAILYICIYTTPSSC